MSKKRSDKGRLPPFVPLLKETLDCPAWRAMSHGARSLYIALKRRYIQPAHNNGKIYLSQRKAAAELNSDRHQIARWFRELQHYGFIVMTAPGSLGVYGKGKAPHWRLPELGYMYDPPTRNFMHWNGIKFTDRKIESRRGNHHQSGGEITATSGGENAATQLANWRGNRRHTGGQSGGGNTAISSSATGVGGAGRSHNECNGADAYPRKPHRANEPISNYERKPL